MDGLSVDEDVEQDGDGDYLRDHAEAALGFDPTLDDTDHDGCPDDVEYVFGDNDASDICTPPSFEFEVPEEIPRPTPFLRFVLLDVPPSGMGGHGGSGLDPFSVMFEPYPSFVAPSIGVVQETRFSASSIPAVVEIDAHGVTQLTPAPGSYPALLREWNRYSSGWIALVEDDIGEVLFSARILSRWFHFPTVI